jgi:cell division septum initiation protein DivIVA
MTADLDGLPFAVVRRGFDRAQVEERLGKLLAERDDAHNARQNALADREHISRELDVSRGEVRAARAELAETRNEVDRLAAQVAELSTIPNTVDGMSDRLQQMVRVAQDEVNDMRARATRGAAQILGMAQAEADELRESARQERRAFEAEQRTAQEELRGRLEESRTQLAALREEADGQRARLDAELADRRTRDEQALAAELADRREVMLADLAGQEKRQREEAQRIVDAASTRARALVADAVAEADRERSQTREQVGRASEELEQLRALQRQVAEQLSGVRSLLDWTLPRINTAGVTGEVAASPGVPLAPLAATAATAPPIAMAPEAPRYDAHALDHVGFAAPGPDGPRPEAQGFDTEGFDAEGFNAEGFDAEGFDAEGFDAEGFDKEGFGSDGRAAAPFDPVTAAEDDDPAHDDRVDASDSAPEPTSGRGTRIPEPRGGDQSDTSRPSPVARSGHRAGARR